MNPITMNLVADDIIRFALREDMNAGDLSTESVCPERREAEVQLIAKAEGVIAGLDVFERAFTRARALMLASPTAMLSSPVSCWASCAATHASCSRASVWP